MDSINDTMFGSQPWLGENSNMFQSSIFDDINGTGAPPICQSTEPSTQPPFGSVDNWNRLDMSTNDAKCTLPSAQIDDMMNLKHTAFLSHSSATLNSNTSHGMKSSVDVRNIPNLSMARIGSQGGALSDRSLLGENNLSFPDLSVVNEHCSNSSLPLAQTSAVGNRGDNNQQRTITELLTLNPPPIPPLIGNGNTNPSMRPFLNATSPLLSSGSSSSGMSRASPVNSLSTDSDSNGNNSNNNTAAIIKQQLAASALAHGMNDMWTNPCMFHGAAQNMYANAYAAAMLSAGMCNSHNVCGGANGGHMCCHGTPNLPFGGAHLNNNGGLPFMDPNVAAMAALQQSMNGNANSANCNPKLPFPPPPPSIVNNNLPHHKLPQSNNNLPPMPPPLPDRFDSNRLDYSVLASLMVNNRGSSASVSTPNESGEISSSPDSGSTTHMPIIHMPTSSSSSTTSTVNNNTCSSSSAISNTGDSVQMKTEKNTTPPVVTPKKKHGGMKGSKRGGSGRKRKLGDSKATDISAMSSDSDSDFSVDSDIDFDLGDDDNAQLLAMDDLDTDFTPFDYIEMRYQMSLVAILPKELLQTAQQQQQQSVEALLARAMTQIACYRWGVTNEEHLFTEAGADLDVPENLRQVKRRRGRPPKKPRVEEDDKPDCNEGEMAYRITTTINLQSIVDAHVAVTNASKDESSAYRAQIIKKIEQDMNVAAVSFLLSRVVACPVRLFGLVQHCSLIGVTQEKMEELQQFEKMEEERRKKKRLRERDRRKKQKKVKPPKRKKVKRSAE